MQETRYQHRTDSVEEKLNLLAAARGGGNHELAMSLAESIKDTLTFERQRQPGDESPAIGDNDYVPVSDLPAAWREWAQGWKFCKVVELRETAGLQRSHEPVDLLIAFRSDQVNDLRREIRVAETTPGGSLREVPSQVYGEKLEGDALVARIVFCADVPARGCATYLLFYGNLCAELPEYVTDLRVGGEGFGLDIENHHFVAQLSRQMGQLERLTCKRAHGVELFAGGEGHGEPPNIDWAHDYCASEHFQKFRVTNWATCPNYEVVKGPLCVKVKRWGFPHSPVHPLFTPARMHINVTYTFYAGLPYFTKEGRMDIVKDFDINYLRDDEWVFSGYSFTDTVWMDSKGTLHEGEVPQEHQDNLWGVGFFHRQSRDAFIALWLEHSAENFDGLHHCGAPVLHYPGHGQLWSRWAASGEPHLSAGAALKQRNAYLAGAYPEDTGAGMVEELRLRLLNPLTATAGAVKERGADLNTTGRLARPGEADEAGVLKRVIWDALREVRDEMLYSVDANVVDMGYVYDVSCLGDVVHVLMTMPHRGRPKYEFIGNSIRRRLLQLDGVRDVIVDCAWEPAWTVNRITDKGKEAMGLD